MGKTKKNKRRFSNRKFSGRKNNLKYSKRKNNIRTKRVKTRKQSKNKNQRGGGIIKARVGVEIDNSWRGPKGREVSFNTETGGLSIDGDTIYLNGKVEDLHKDRVGYKDDGDGGFRISFPKKIVFAYKVGQAQAAESLKTAISDYLEEGDQQMLLRLIKMTPEEDVTINIKRDGNIFSVPLIAKGIPGGEGKTISLRPPDTRSEEADEIYKRAFGADESLQIYSGLKAVAGKGPVKTLKWLSEDEWHDIGNRKELKFRSSNGKYILEIVNQPSASEPFHLLLEMNESLPDLIALYEPKSAHVESGGATGPTHRKIFQDKLNEIFPPG